ncbi:hypothetical protein ACFFTM_24230 [Pseudoduganella plicata]|uniref:RES domain-containing protein n=1 Tax=Pseudoduganella plicata TaxID=321984 RepID=A0ABX5SDL7_9BURK|nr:hypothetical protein [Pseudoduganella plicata]QBQ37355.1 hypothetical protein E1742_15170 [Pseudoduganella plicata]
MEVPVAWQRGGQRPLHFTTYRMATSGHFGMLYGPKTTAAEAVVSFLDTGRKRQAVAGRKGRTRVILGEIVVESAIPAAYAPAVEPLE